MAWLGELDAFSQHHTWAVMESIREVERIMQSFGALAWNGPEADELWMILTAMLCLRGAKPLEEQFKQRGKPGQTFHRVAQDTFLEGAALARIWSIGFGGQNEFLRELEKKLRIVLVRRAQAMLYEYLMNMGVWLNTCPYDEEVCRTCFLRFCCIQLGGDIQLELAVSTSLLLAYHKEFGNKPCNTYSLTANLFPSTTERKELTWLARRSTPRAWRARPRRSHGSCKLTEAIELQSDTEETDKQASDDSDGDVIVSAIELARE